jgi:hypothetical protein
MYFPRGIASSRVTATMAITPISSVFIQLEFFWLYQHITEINEN